MIKFDFINPPRAVRPVAFWFLNHWLEDEELIRQIDEMAERGMGAVMLHPRDGLRTEYLSDTFAKRLETAVKRAAEHGMCVWLYDENHYPSGPAGFKLEIDGRSMQSLLCIAEEQIPPGGRLDAPGADFVVVVNPDTGATLEQAWVPEDWHNGAKGFAFRVHKWQANPSSHFYNYPDYTDAELTDAFLQLTHEWYREKLGSFFGTVIRGIFSDNTCGNFGIHRRSAPWGRDFPERFAEATGEKLHAMLPRLFDASLPGACEARQLYWDFFDKAYLDSYFGRITGWCDRHGILSTGHLACEDGLLEHIRQCGDYFDVMRHFSYCAVDDLGPAKTGSDLVERNGDAGWLPAKITASCARFLGRSEVMCECFGLASEPWNLTLREMRRISGWLAVAGINVFVPHGLYYSIAGHRKWECPPDHVHTPSWKYYSRWTDWIARYSLAAIGGVNLAETVLLYPARAMRSLIELGNPSGNGALADYGEEADLLQMNFRKTVDCLFANHINFEIVDESLLGRGDLSVPGILRIPAADPAFDLPARAVILAGSAEVAEETAVLLRKFAAGGGRIYLAGVTGPAEVEGVWLPADADWKSILPAQVVISDSVLCSRCWMNRGEFFCLVHNRSDEFREAEIQFPGRESLCLIDPEDGSCRPWCGPILKAAPAQMFLFTTLTNTGKQAASPLLQQAIPLPEKWDFFTDKPNVLPLQEWKTKFSGMTQREIFTFHCDFVPGDLRLILDLEQSKAELAAGGFGKRLKCLLNGKEIPALTKGSYLDPYMFEAPLAEWVIKGGNALEILRESLLHEWEYRTNPPMITGTFELDASNRIIPISGKANGYPGHPGFPYFAGETCFCCELEIPLAGGCIELNEVQARSCVVAAEVDGEIFGIRVVAPYAFDMTPFAGRKITLTLRFANTNAALFQGRTANS